MLSETDRESYTISGCNFHCDVLYPEFTPIKTLLEWSENFEGINPFCLYLDLIGFSEEYFDTPCCPIESFSPISHILGYKELCLLADALKVFEIRGYDPVYTYIDHLISKGETED